MEADPPSGVWSGRRVLISGGGGFIGAHLTRRLARDGAEVHAVGRSKPLRVDEDAHTWACDLSRHDDVQRLIETVRPEILFHLAGTVTGARQIDHVRPTFESNLSSTVNLLIAATQSSCERIVITGSMEEPRPDESDPMPPSPYAAAKWASTMYARMFHALYGSPVVVLRVFMAYGPGQRDGTKLIPYVGRCFLDGTAPKLSSGRRPVDWVYVDDVVDAHISAAQSERAVGQTMDVGTGTQVTIRDVVERIARITGTEVEPAFGALPERPLETAPVADVEETYKLIGWRARTNLDDGLRATVAWLRDPRD
jgi:nucleoside-diphosphate-sugar epimerase